jgi:uncharacterized protein YecE (DUF72 family)
MAGKIHIGVGGWTFEPWRGVFYPDGLAQKRELQYMGEQMTSVEINGTFYGSQKPESFQKWHDEVPEDFVFALKGTRYVTNRRVLAEATESLSRFLTSGVTRLNRKLGPINWQLAATKKFDADDFAAFLDLLPHEIEAQAGVPRPDLGRIVREAMVTLGEYGHGIDASGLDGFREYCRIELGPHVLALR